MIQLNKVSFLLEKVFYCNLITLSIKIKISTAYSKSSQRPTEGYRSNLLKCSCHKTISLFTYYSETVFYLSKFSKFKISSSVKIWKM